MTVGSVTVTKSPDTRRCKWCGRGFEVPAGPGRPAEYCRTSHRQRDYEARRRSAELGLSETELVVTRRALDELRDQVYILECAIEDVVRDLAADDSPEVGRRSVDWLLEAARPLIATRILGEG
jgi:hypothetical protein